MYPMVLWFKKILRESDCLLRLPRLGTLLSPTSPIHTPTLFTSLLITSNFCFLLNRFPFKSIEITIFTASDQYFITTRLYHLSLFYFRIHCLNLHLSCSFWYLFLIPSSPLGTLYITLCILGFIICTIFLFTNPQHFAPYNNRYRPHYGLIQFCLLM